MWPIELEPEVETWVEGLPAREFAIVLAHVGRLGEQGNRMRMPASRTLGNGLFELRFDVAQTARGITYFFASGSGRRIVLLTTFRKQRRNERAEVQRARNAMARCMAEGHMAEGHMAEEDY